MRGIQQCCKSCHTNFGIPEGEKRVMICNLYNRHQSEPVLNSGLQTKRAKLARFLPTWNLCDLSQSTFKYVSYIVWCFLKCPQITDSPFKIKTCPDAAERREARCFRFEQLIKLTIPRGHWNVRWPASIHAYVFDFDSPNKFKIPCSLPIITETNLCVSGGMHPCEDLDPGN